MEKASEKEYFYGGARQGGIRARLEQSLKELEEESRKREVESFKCEMEYEKRIREARIRAALEEKVNAAEEKMKKNAAEFMYGEPEQAFPRKVTVTTIDHMGRRSEEVVTLTEKFTIEETPTIMYDSDTIKRWLLFTLQLLKKESLLHKLPNDLCDWYQANEKKA